MSLAKRASQRFGVFFLLVLFLTPAGEAAWRGRRSWCPPPEVGVPWGPAELLPDPEQAVRAVLDAQVAAWNRGDLEGFMAGYWQSPDLTFFSGDKVTRGWPAT